jgi:hypothetical protein
MAKDDFYPGSNYQGLYNLMANNHNLNLTLGEMDEIIKEARKVFEIIKPEFSPCDCEVPLKETQLFTCGKCLGLIGTDKLC